MKTPPHNGTTGLPGLRTWRRVYVFVLVVYAAWIGLLAALTRVYS